MQIVCNWSRPPSKVYLLPNEVHVWRASLQVPNFVLDKYSQLLSDDELSRRDRFHFEKDRRRYSFGRGVLRFILGIYLGADPKDVDFSYGDYGKPFLDSALYDIPIHFNHAHSNDLSLYAFSLSRSVGIDVEYMRPIPDYDKISENNFSLGENAILQKLPENLKQEAFYNIWTRKEAYIKAVGCGLTIPLNTFEVSVISSEPVRLKSTDCSYEKAYRWRMESFNPSKGYAAAIVVEGYDWRPEWLILED
jgi:4'-phosphopantetheinyl transferase